ncbi:MAG: hypothetical protein GY795_29440 [Desulfobacterales bacterium]|nr:hypothetical protein [Desulfobacterales bacterium]
MTNRLFELSSLFRPLLKGKTTVRHLWNCMLGELRLIPDLKDTGGLSARRIQFRYE